MFSDVVYYHCSEFKIFRPLNGSHFLVLSLYPHSVQNQAWFCLHFSDHGKPKQTDVIFSRFVSLSLVNHGRFPRKNWPIAGFSPLFLKAENYGEKWVPLTWWSGYCDSNKRECDLNQSKDGSFVKRVAKNNNRNNGYRHKILEKFLIDCFVFVIILLWQTVHSLAMAQITANLMETTLQLTVPG